MAAPVAFNVAFDSGSPDADPRESLREAAFEAVKTQLGLNVVRKKVTVEALVIDHVEKPSASEN